MNSAFIILVLIVIGYFFLRGNTRKGKLYLLIFGCVLLALESGLRHISVGPDTDTYYRLFSDTCSDSWINLLAGFVSDNSEIRDPAFAVLEKAFYTIIPSWQLFLMAIAFLYFYSLGRLFNKYIPSIDGVVFAFVLYLALFHIVALSGIRQQITMALSMLIIPWINEKDWKKVIPIIALGVVIHISMLFVAFLIPLMYVSRSNVKVFFAIAIILIPVMAMNARPIVAYMASFSGNEYYSQYAEKINDANPIVYVALCSIISVFQMMYVKYLLNNQNYSFLVPTCILMTLFVPLIFLDGAMIRIGQYFTIYMMVSLPIIFQQINSGRVIQLGAILFLSYMVSKSSLEYTFFWTNVSGYIY